jgi:hypothetical protein
MNEVTVEATKVATNPTSSIGWKAYNKMAKIGQLTRSATKKSRK